MSTTPFNYLAYSVEFEKNTGLKAKDNPAEYIAYFNLKVSLAISANLVATYNVVNSGLNGGSVNPLPVHVTNHKDFKPKP